MAEADELIKLADGLATEIRKVGATAKTEEDVRINVELALRPVLERFGLRVEPRYEEGIPRGTTAYGRADAIYGGVYIEYEGPGKLERAATRAASIQQVQEYLVGATPKAEEDGRTPRLVGVALDGSRLIFVRPRGPRSTALDYYHPEPAALADGDARWSVTDPLHITRESVAQLLHYLRALAREPLTAVALARAFGPESEIGPRLVGAFYERLIDRRSTLAETLFAEWDRIFGIVYGQDAAKEARDAQILGDLYGVKNPDLKRLFFAVHTYYALIMKLLAVEVASLQQGSYITSFVEEVDGLDDDGFDRKLQALEDGSEFRRLEITNYLEGDFFRWYLSAWDDKLRSLIRDCVRRLDAFEPSSGVVRPDLARDILKHLYQYLVPKQLRHDLGEYYTPDWLAEFLLNEVGYEGDPQHRVLDPACGSGTFLALEIARAISYADRNLLAERDLAHQIVRNVVGFDLNPLAVLAARTTYLLSLGHLLRYVRPLEIPVYLCDSVLLPRPQAGGLISRGRELMSSVGLFIIPGAIDDGDKMARFTDVLERAVRGKHDPDGLIETVERRVTGLDDSDRELLRELYAKLRDLDAQGRNGIWPRIIKNSFAPLFVSRERFDFVIGNPPWVNWESLSDEYRRATRRLWVEYGLFSLRGHEVNLGGGKKDLSMLMLYASAQNYLRPEGMLAFLITQTLFKSAGAGAGFRRLRLSDTTPLGVQVVHDMTSLQPFEGATNRTAAVVMKRDADTAYPVRWVHWRRKGKGGPRTNAPLDEVLRNVELDEMEARPLRGDATSPWLTESSEAAGTAHAIGKSAYRAYAGSFTGGLNGAYWVEVLAERTDGTLLIRNLHDIGKIKVQPVETTIEPDLVYPLLRGRDVGRWRAKPSISIILSQDPDRRIGWDASWLRTKLPLTFEYLSNFEEQLRKRGSRVVRNLIEKGPFYSMYAVGPYTMSTWKVVWREQASAMTAAVVGPVGVRPVIPDHKLMLVPCESELEAQFVCGALNSSIVRQIVASYTISTSISTHVLEHVKVPRFDPTNGVHSDIAHEAQRIPAGEGSEAELDRLVAKLWE